MLHFTEGCYLWVLLMFVPVPRLYSHTQFLKLIISKGFFSGLVHEDGMFSGDQSLPVTGNGCLDGKSSAISLFINELKVHISHSFLDAGRELDDYLGEQWEYRFMGSDNLKSGLGIQNLFLALWITKASFSLWLFLFSVKATVRLMK